MTSPIAARRPSHSAVDEATPLLAASGAGPTAQGADEEPLVKHHDQPAQHQNGDDDDKPLPRLQIFLLCYARLVEPIAFFSIFPFINKMIWETGNLKQADVGFYSGLIVNSPMFPLLKATED